MKNDMQMQQDVLAALEQDQRSVTRSIGVEVHHVVVKLAGQVDDDATKRTAELAARQVDGVTDVVMDVDVKARARTAAGGAERAPEGPAL